MPNASRRSWRTRNRCRVFHDSAVLQEEEARRYLTIGVPCPYVGEPLAHGIGAMPRQKVRLGLASSHRLPGPQRDDELLGASIHPKHRSDNIAFFEPEHLRDLNVG